MKNILLAIFVTSVSGLGFGQNLKESEVPGTVKSAFAKKFPKAKEVKWSKESATEFEAEFENMEFKQAANFDQAGKWLVTETVIKKSELPKDVQATIAKDFPDYKIEEAEKAESYDQGAFFEVELKKGKIKYEVRLSADGKVLKKEEIKEKEEKKN